MGAVLETSRALGVDGHSPEQLARGGHFAILNMGPGVKTRQRSYHISLLQEVISGAEQMRLPDFYVSNAVFATKRSRLISNVKSLQVAWVDLDCYTLRIAPTQEFVETLIHRARFSEIPIPSHIMTSGRGLYLKWLLDKPVPDSLLPAWNHVQRKLNQLYVDVGADIKAMDAARVLRVVNTLNGKVVAEANRSSSGVVGVVWNEGPPRHSFEDLWQAVNLLDEGTTEAIQKAGEKVAHRAGRTRLNPTFTEPPRRPGDLSLLLDTRCPSFELEAEAKACGKGNGFSSRSLTWARFVDLRNLAHRRAAAAGGSGIPEGSRDLTMLWMVNFLAQSGVVNSGNFYREVDGLMRAFDNADLPGPRGFENPRTSGALATLHKRVKASEEGHQVRFAGALWDPIYTPSNDYLINLFGITPDEMRDLSTIIDSAEKRARADRKVEGRAQRREMRLAWNDQALRMRDELAEARKNGDSSVPEQKVCSSIAKALNLTPNKIRNFLRRHDDKAAMGEARKLGKAPPRAYRKASELSLEEWAARNALNAKRKHARFIAGLRKSGYAGDGSAEDVHAWLTAKAEASHQEAKRNAEAVVKEARDATEKCVRRMNATLERILRAAAKRAGAGDVLDELASADQGGAGAIVSEPPSGDLNDDAADHSTLSANSETVARTLLRAISQMRDNAVNEAPTMNTSPSAPSSSDGSFAVSTADAARMTSKRFLLNKARKAQNKEPLQLSAIDRAPATTIGWQAASQSPPADVARVAASVIPPELMDQWAGPAPEDSEPAGMPDLDDGYLDSFSQGEGGAVSIPQAAGREQAPSATPVHRPPVAGVSSISSRPPRPLAFAHGARLGVPTTPAGSSAFGFKRPAESPVPDRAGQASAKSSVPPASGAVGFVPVRRSPKPAQPLGFGGTARLSSDQARTNGLHQDFAKLFDEARYDADGVPVSYPKADVWPHEDLPAGSRYTREEWANAREPDQEIPTGHVVVELQVGKPMASALIKVPRKLVLGTAVPTGPRTRVVDGRVVHQEDYRGIDDPLADAIADTIIVSRKSPIAPEVRGAVEGGIAIIRGGVGAYYRFIRPKSHYTDPEKFMYIDSKLQMTGSLGEVGARLVRRVEAAPVEADKSELTEPEGPEIAEAPRA